MITVTVTETRPSTDVDFWDDDGSFVLYIQKYNDIRHRTIYGWSYSSDMLQRTFTDEYNSSADFDTFVNDPIVQQTLQTINDYNIANSINRTFERINT